MLIETATAGDLHLRRRKLHPQAHRGRPMKAMAITVILATLLVKPVVTKAMEASAPDSTAIAATAAAFHAALAAGDSTAALALLAADAVVLESGELETRAQYAAHHLAADIEFARALGGERTVTGVRQVGVAAWLWAVSSVRGTWHGREVDSIGTELLVLAKEGEAWRIRAIHWSSRKR
jgi:ketosteroid isomerase-like protein